jgi:hypothetical protein
MTLPYRLIALLGLSLQLFTAAGVHGQDSIPYRKDTFFLAKKKGVLGKLGKSIAANDNPTEGPVKIDVPFAEYKGKIIRQIYITGLGFERNFYDTNRVKKNIGITLAKALHRNTADPVIRKNLFFREGNPLIPYLLADNERHLRELEYIQDARFEIVPAENSTDSVDVWLVTKDVFSLGGTVNARSANEFNFRAYDKNLFGRGNQLTLYGLYDFNRSPRAGYGAEYLHRNLLGSFIDWSTGFQTLAPGFNSGRREEVIAYTRFVKPLVSPYFGWTGALDLSFHKLSNNYLSDSIFKREFKYQYTNADLWFGYNLGARRMLIKNTSSRLKKFIAVRFFHDEFQRVPGRFANEYNFQYADLSGVLGALTIFKQSFYRTRFVYGFGRSEDVPEGFSASIIGGWTNKQDRNRPYMGIDFQWSKFKRSGHYTSYTARIGGYLHQEKTEDLDLLFDISHFTPLRHLGRRWYHRWFFSGSMTKQVAPILNEPLFLNSRFGLPQFNNGDIKANSRTVLRTESVFYNTWKFLGFRFAPFVFCDAAFLTTENKGFRKGDIFSSPGAGIRTRNESLIFETIELKTFVFPRRNEGMKGVRVEFSTNIRFKYNSTFIRRPEFVVSN